MEAALWVVLGVVIGVTVLVGLGLLAVWWEDSQAAKLPVPPPETQPALTKQEREYFEAVEEIEQLEAQAYVEIERLLRW